MTLRLYKDKTRWSDPGVSPSPPPFSDAETKTLFTLFKLVWLITFIKFIVCSRLALIANFHVLNSILEFMCVFLE